VKASGPNLDGFLLGLKPLGEVSEGYFLGVVRARIPIYSPGHEIAASTLGRGRHAGQRCPDSWNQRME
jgi:hypothetical protein